MLKKLFILTLLTSPAMAQTYETRYDKPFTYERGEPITPSPQRFNAPVVESTYDRSYKGETVIRCERDCSQYIGVKPQEHDSPVVIWVD